MHTSGWKQHWAVCRPEQNASREPPGCKNLCFSKKRHNKVSEVFRSQCPKPFKLNVQKAWPLGFDFLIFDSILWPKMFLKKNKHKKWWMWVDFSRNHSCFDVRRAWRCTELAQKMIFFFLKAAATKNSGGMLQKKERTVDIYFLSLCVCEGHLISKRLMSSLCWCGRCYWLNWTVWERDGAFRNAKRQAWRKKVFIFGSCSLLRWSGLHFMLETSAAILKV